MNALRGLHESRAPRRRCRRRSARNGASSSAPRTARPRRRRRRASAEPVTRASCSDTLGQRHRRSSSSKMRNTSTSRSLQRSRPGHRVDEPERPPARRRDLVDGHPAARRRLVDRQSAPLRPRHDPEHGHDRVEPALRDRLADLGERRAVVERELAGARAVRLGVGRVGIVQAELLVSSSGVMPRTSGRGRGQERLAARLGRGPLGVEPGRAQHDAGRHVPEQRRPGAVPAHRERHRAARASGRRAPRAAAAPRLREHSAQTAITPSSGPCTSRLRSASSSRGASKGSRARSTSDHVAGVGRAPRGPTSLADGQPLPRVAGLGVESPVLERGRDTGTRVHSSAPEEHLAAGEPSRPPRGPGRAARRAGPGRAGRPSRSRRRRRTAAREPDRVRPAPGNTGS